MYDVTTMVIIFCIVLQLRKQFPIDHRNTSKDHEVGDRKGESKYETRECHLYILNDIIQYQYFLDGKTS